MPIIIIASDFAEVTIVDQITGTPAKVTSDSALYVTSNGDTSFVKIADTAQVIVMDTVRTYAIDYKLEIAAGRIPNTYCDKKFGRTTNADLNTKTDVWDGANSTDNIDIWIAPTQARIHAITSTSTNDSVTGTGARTIQVYGLVDWDTKETSEVVNMDGITGPNTVNSYVIVHRMKVLTKGTAGPNVGYVKATAATDATVTAQFNPLEGQTKMAIYGIPSTQTAYMTQFYYSILKSGGGTIAVDCDMLYNPEPQTEITTFLIKHTTAKLSTGTSDGSPHPFNPYNKFTGPGILKLQVISSQNDMDVSAGFDLILEDN